MGELMKNWRRSKKQKDENFPAMILPNVDDTPLITFPSKVIAPLRHMVARTARSEPFPARLAMMASLRQEGASYLSLALATTMAHDMEETVCVVELNWQWPSEILLDVSKNGGLTAVLTNETELDDAIIRTGLPNLALLPAGNMAAEKRSSFARGTMLKKTIEELSEKFDHLVLDIPAILASNDAIPLASLSTASCLIVRQGATSVGDARLALADVDHLSILGVIMNQVHLYTPSIILRRVPQY